MNTNETYKGFNIEYFICRKGFNQYKLTITKYRYKGTKQEEFFMERINTTTNKKAVARKEAKTFIDNIKKIEWQSNGMLNCPYLPNRKGLKEAYTIVVDFGKPYEETIRGEKVLREKLQQLKAMVESEEYSYNDIQILNSKGQDVTEQKIKESEQE